MFVKCGLPQPVEMMKLSPSSLPFHLSNSPLPPLSLPYRSDTNESLLCSRETESCTGVGTLHRRSWECPFPPPPLPCLWEQLCEDCNHSCCYNNTQLACNTHCKINHHHYHPCIIHDIQIVGGTSMILYMPSYFMLDSLLLSVTCVIILMFIFLAQCYSNSHVHMCTCIIIRERGGAWGRVLRDIHDQQWMRQVLIIKLADHEP